MHKRVVHLCHLATVIIIDAKYLIFLTQKLQCCIKVLNLELNRNSDIITDMHLKTMCTSAGGHIQSNCKRDRIYNKTDNNSEPIFMQTVLLL